MNKTCLSDIAEINMGQSPKGDTCNYIGIGKPLLNGPTEFGDFYPAAKQYTTSGKKLSIKGDILFCVRGSTTGRMNWADKEYVLGRGLASIRHKKGEKLNHFLKYLIEINLNSILKSTSGSTFPNLTSDMLNSFKVATPDDIQAEIINDFLKKLDSKIELNNRINAELEAMAKTLYDYWFVQFDFPTSAAYAATAGRPELEGKPYKSCGGKMVWNEELKRDVPEGWEVGMLLDIAVYTNGLACQKYRPTNGDYLPVIKIREMRDGFTENTEKVKKDIPEKLIVNDGDILFSWSASLEVMIWSGGSGGLNQHIFKVTSEKYPKSFYYFQLVWYLQHFKMIADLRKTTMGHITQDHLKQSRIVIPHIDIVNQVDKHLKPIQSKQVLLKRQNQQLTSLRDWLLPMLMNGQVKVNKQLNIK